MKFELGQTVDKSSPAEIRLVDALLRSDQESALKLLMDAGGACQTRNLVKQAEVATQHMPFIHHSLAIDGIRETISVGRETNKGYLPLVSLTQQKCEK